MQSKIHISLKHWGYAGVEEGIVQPKTTECGEEIGDRCCARDDGRAAVGSVADDDVERHFAQERNAERLGLAAGAGVREDVGASAAMRAEEKAHVLDDAEKRSVDLLEHRDRAARVDQREVLRRRDDDRAGQRDVLRHRQLGVAGARRHVDDQDVERAPGRPRAEAG